MQRLYATIMTMTYGNFTLESIVETFQIGLQRQPLFVQIQPIAIPSLLQEILAEGMSMSFVSEKARSEIIIMPLLLTVRKLCHQAITIYSGHRFDVDPSTGLTGECDFLLTVSPPLPIIQTPVVTIVEAKKQDIEAGLGQCAAQTIAAQQFNQSKGQPIATIYGCVTTGEDWQFLKLEGHTITIDSSRYYINDVGTLLSIFYTILQPYLPL